MHYKQEARVGFLVIVAVVITVGGLMWLSGVPLVGGRQTTVPVVFSNISGLSVGDPVMMSGLQIGRVSDVRLEEVGRVMVFLQLTSNTWRPHIDARASVKSFDFLGSKMVDYMPGNSSELLGDGQIITGSRESDVFESATGLTDDAAAVLTGLQSFLAPNVLDELKVTMQAVQRAMDVIGDAGGGSLMENAGAAMTSLRSSATRVDSLLANPALERSVNQLDEITTSLQEMADGLAGTTTALSAVLERLNSGEGSLGLALTDSTLYHSANDVLVSLRELLDDIRERPGRYFRLKVF